MKTFKNKDTSDILDYKYKIHRRKAGVAWGIVNFVVAVVLGFDLKDGSVSKLLISISPVLWYLELYRFPTQTECMLFVIFSLNVLFDFGSYFLTSFGTSSWNISTQLRTLLGIRDSEDCFCAPSGNNSSLSKEKDSPLTPEKNVNLSNFFYSSTPERLPTTSRLWSSSPSSPLSLELSLTDSSQMNSTSASSWTYFDGDISTRLHRSAVSNRKLPLDAENIILDEKSLTHYLREMEETESHLLGLADISQTSATSSHWSADATFGSDLSPVANKFPYQISTRSPQSNTQHSTDQDSSAGQQQEVWSRIGVLPDAVFSWTENLRKWLGKTVLSRLVAEIDKVNEALRWQGMTDVQIGEVGLNVLRQRTKGPQLETLYVVLQYLEVTPSQDYLIHRLKELDKGGCMSEFRWNAGGPFKGKPWGDHLPTDSAIVFHMFCVYLDSRLPLHSGFPDGKPFTSKYFCKTPDQPDLKRNSLCFYQSSINPPHFKLVVGDELWDMPKGRNNLFHVILLFLHMLRVKEDGMLNRINLGPSGLNMLWIIE